MEQGELVSLTVYRPPNGRGSRESCIVGKEHREKAEGMVLSAEILSSGEIALYGRYQEEKEEEELLEIAKNGPGEKSPANMLRKVIDNVYERKHGKGDK